MEEKVAEGPKQVGRDLEAKISFYSLQVEISFGETKLPCPRTRWVVSTLWWEGGKTKGEWGSP